MWDNMDYFFIIVVGVYLICLTMFLQQVGKASDAFLCFFWPIFLIVACFIELKEKMYERTRRKI